jgi:CheY-like chemotaxis protein
MRYFFWFSAQRIRAPLQLRPDLTPANGEERMAKGPILIVDDNPANLELLLVILARDGYELHTATDAAEALTLLDTITPCLILLDLQLPGMDGLELTRRLKAKETTATIPIVAVTAFAMKGDEEKARQAGCDAYLTKPIDKRILRDVVAGYFRDHACAPHR